MANDDEYRSMLTMLGRSERYTREEASWHLYEHYSDAKRRWRHFTGRLLGSNDFTIEVGLPYRRQCRRK
eukprot:12860696-Prorocentrum_lima.AAC.1